MEIIQDCIEKLKEAATPRGKEKDSSSNKDKSDSLEE
jgi:hypothetical protein